VYACKIRTKSGSLVSSGVDIPLKNKEMGPLKRSERFPEGEFYPIFA
jgi:hypothetical protein